MDWNDVRVNDLVLTYFPCNSTMYWSICTAATTEILYFRDLMTSNIEESLDLFGITINKEPDVKLLKIIPLNLTFEGFEEYLI